MISELKQLFEKFTPMQIAFRLGVSLAAVYNWKRGASNPSPLAKEKIKEIFGV